MKGTRGNTGERSSNMEKKKLNLVNAYKYQALPICWSCLLCGYNGNPLSTAVTVSIGV